MNNRENGRNAGMRRDTNTIARCGNGRDGYVTEAYVRTVIHSWMGELRSTDSRLTPTSGGKRAGKPMTPIRAKSVRILKFSIEGFQLFRWDFGWELVLTHGHSKCNGTFVDDNALSNGWRCGTREGLSYLHSTLRKCTPLRDTRKGWIERGGGTRAWPYAHL